MRDKHKDFRRRGASVAAVAQGTVEEIHTFLDEMRLPFPVLADPERAVYALYQLPMGGLLSLVTPRTMAAAQQMARDHGVAVDTRASMLAHSSWRQMPGTFVIDTTGTCRYEQVGQDSSDTAPVAAILQAIDACKA